MTNQELLHRVEQLGKENQLLFEALRDLDSTQEKLTVTTLVNIVRGWVAQSRKEDQ